MTRDEITQAVLATLAEIAPEVDPSEVVPDVDLRDQLDIDSMDFLNFVIALHERLGVDIPERDYPQLGTLDAIVDYVARSSPQPDQRPR
ncbi:MAG TPA: acyl carrier protein [Gaiellaceae bacterium]|nr:acyl carrier protein [Gaiellaceae bacterium]